MFNQCSAAFAEIAAVHVGNTIDVSDVRVMYVPADDAVTAVCFGIAAEVLFVVADKVHSLLDLVLGPSTEAPIR